MTDPRTVAAFDQAQAAVSEALAALDARQEQLLAEWRAGCVADVARSCRCELCKPRQRWWRRRATT